MATVFGLSLSLSNVVGRESSRGRRTGPDQQPRPPPPEERGHLCPVHVLPETDGRRPDLHRDIRREEPILECLEPALPLYSRQRQMDQRVLLNPETKARIQGG